MSSYILSGHDADRDDMLQTILRQLNKSVKVIDSSVIRKDVFLYLAIYIAV